MRRSHLLPQLPWFPVLVAAVVLGLLSIPVECSVAVGPHSMFADARDVATLQGAVTGGDSHRHGHAALMAGAVTMSDQVVTDVPRSADLMASMTHGVRESGHLASTLSATGMRATPPSPAGITSDAIVTIAMPRIEHALLVSGFFLRIGVEKVLPPASLQFGPEPPPPRGLAV
jgi:hypothetical protein